LQKNIVERHKQNLQKIYPRGSNKCIEFLWKSVIEVAALDGHKDPVVRSHPPRCLSAIGLGQTARKDAWRTRLKRRRNRTNACGKEADEKRLSHECRKRVNVAPELRPNITSRIIQRKHYILCSWSCLGKRGVYRILHCHVQEALLCGKTRFHSWWNMKAISFRISFNTFL